MSEEPVYTGYARWPTILYVAIEDEERAQAMAPDMEIIVDWRLRPGSWFAVTTHHEIPPMPEGFLDRLPA